MRLTVGVTRWWPGYWAFRTACCSCVPRPRLTRLRRWGRVAGAGIRRRSRWQAGSHSRLISFNRQAAADERRVANEFVEIERTLAAGKALVLIGADDDDFPAPLAGDLLRAVGQGLADEVAEAGLRVLHCPFGLTRS